MGGHIQSLVILAGSVERDFPFCCEELRADVMGLHVLQVL